MNNGVKLSDIMTLVIEDDIYKAINIKKALSYCGIKNIKQVSNQEVGMELIYESVSGDLPVKLIVTDMHYPLVEGGIADHEAGFKLIERLKKEKIDIPVIICSTKNYKDSNIMGSVWYNDFRDINLDFNEIIKKLIYTEEKD